MEKIRENVKTAVYIRHVYSYQLHNIEYDTVIVYYTNHGSPWFNNFTAAENWLSKQEMKRLDSDNTQRPSTKWEFVSFFNVDVKVVLDRQPLLGTGPLPDWLRNLAHGRLMVALDTYHGDLCGVVLLYTVERVLIEAQQQRVVSPRVSTNSKLCRPTAQKHLWMK